MYLLSLESSFKMQEIGFGFMLEYTIWKCSNLIKSQSLPPPFEKSWIRHCPPPTHTHRVAPGTAQMSRRALCGSFAESMFLQLVIFEICDFEIQDRWLSSKLTGPSSHLDGAVYQVRGSWVKEILNSHTDMHLCTLSQYKDTCAPMHSSTQLYRAQTYVNAK